MSVILEYKSDEILKGPIWAKQIENLKGHVFETQWELYALCVAIGIMHDQQLEYDKGTDDEQHQISIPRSMLNKGKNQDLLSFLFQTSVLTSRLISFTEDERLELAFAEEPSIPFDRRAFLTKFANFGISELDKILEGYDQDLEKLDAIRNYLDTSYTKEFILPEVDGDLIFEIEDLEM